MPLTVSASWRAGASFQIRTGSGHSLVTDGAIEHGGVNAGPRPMELLLAAAASCSAFDVVMILKRGKHEVAEAEVVVCGTRSDAVPAVFTALDLAFTVRGAPAPAAKRAVKLSVDKYCSVLAMLAQSATVTWQVAIPD